MAYNNGKLDKGKQNNFTKIDYLCNNEVNKKPKRMKIWRNTLMIIFARSRSVIRFFRTLSYAKEKLTNRNIIRNQ